MDYYELARLLENPTVRLLRANNAPLVLGFLHSLFKTNRETALPESHLQAALDSYLEDLRGTDPDLYQRSSLEYLSQWCSDGQGFLRRYYVQGSDEPHYELTSGSERAFRWLEGLRGTQHIGTESRLEGVFLGLNEIARNTTTDPDVRARQLEEDIDKLRDEIALIRATGKVKSFTSVQVNERFAFIIRNAKELLSDFREVEENFRRIAREISARQGGAHGAKGEIMAHMLDSHDALRRSEQGQSFFAFWQLLLTPERKEHFERCLELVERVSELAEGLKQDGILHDLIPHLLREAQKVMASYRQMTGNLRRVLDTAHRSEQHRIAELLQEIRSRAIEIRDRAPLNTTLFEMEVPPEVFSAMSRPLWTPPAAVVSDHVLVPAEDHVSAEDLIRFQNLPHIELEKLRRNLDTFFLEKEHGTLQEVIDRFPPSYGMMEVLGYLMIASSEERHLVHDEEDLIQIAPTERWHVPRVTFTHR